jgi:type IV secretion system protein VirB9
VPPEQAIAKANKAARVEPTRAGYINAIQVYPWTEGALFRLYASPEKVSTVALQPGEELIDVSTGDTVRWVIGDTMSGQGVGRRVHILIKPTLPDIQTNLVVLTDRRAYHLELVSTKQTYMASISWTYPTDSLVALHKQNEAARDNEARVADRGVRLDSLNFRYRIEGDDPPWRPLRAFDDGHKVFIQMPSGLSQGEAPPLFVAGADGRPNLVNYRVRGSYYIVDRMFGAAELRLGENPQRTVRIIRIDARPVSQLPGSGSAT